MAEWGLNTLAINLSLDLDDRHGMVDCPTPHRHRDADAMGEIAAWVVWLNNKGAGPVTLLGHSRGGNQAARYAAGNPDPAVKRLVLVAPATSNPGKPARGYYRRYKKDLEPLLKKARDLMAAGKGDALMKDVDFLYCPKTTVSAATFADYYGANPERDTPSVIRRITLPVLAVAGGSDRVNPHFGKKMKKLPQANVKLVVIEDAGHFSVIFSARTWPMPSPNSSPKAQKARRGRVPFSERRKRNSPSGCPAGPFPTQNLFKSLRTLGNLELDLSSSIGKPTNSLSSGKTITVFF